MTEIERLERLAAIRKYFKEKWIERKRKRNLATKEKSAKDEIASNPYKTYVRVYSNTITRMAVGLPGKYYWIEEKASKNKNL